ncbi:MAG TPA: PIN domain-containing protein [Chthonomonadaceae bacterium]|nr:PIN domain-containing protein [Chthonomonadaceae bacterium]
MTLTDAGVLVALVDKGQPQNPRCRAIYLTARLPLLTTWPAFAEAIYLLYRIGGWPLQRRLWQYVQEETLIFHASSTEEQLRMRELMEQYRDRPMDLADASLVAAAEASGDKRIFTIDSDFYIYQWNGREPFEVVP